MPVSARCAAPYTADMHCKLLAPSVEVLVGWLLAACMAHGQTVNLAYTSDAANSYADVPVPELVYARFGKSPDPVVRLSLIHI